MNGWTLSPSRGWTLTTEEWVSPAFHVSEYVPAYVGAVIPMPSVPLVDFSGGDPIFQKTVALRVTADSASTAADMKAYGAISTHSDYGPAVKAIDAAIALWSNEIMEAYKAGALTSSVSSPEHVQNVSAQFQAEGGSRRAALQARREELFTDLASHFTLGGGAPPPSSGPVYAPPGLPPAPSPNATEAPPEALPAGMLVGWAVALAAVGWIFFRVAIMKRPL
jgi:hypothetical protein